MSLYIYIYIYPLQHFQNERKTSSCRRKVKHFKAFRAADERKNGFVRRWMQSGGNTTLMIYSFQTYYKLRRFQNMFQTKKLRATVRPIHFHVHFRGKAGISALHEGKVSLLCACRLLLTDIMKWEGRRQDWVPAVSVWECVSAY